MAKKDKDTIFKEYLAELEAINPSIKDILADEKVSAKLKEGVLARADYSSSMDTLRAERESFASEVAEARNRISGWQKWYGDVSTEVSKTQEELKAYREAYGDLDAAGQRREARKAGLTQEEFEKRLNDEIGKRDLANLKFADDLTDIKIDYRDRFKEKLDTAEVYKIAGERGTDLLTAYNLHIADRVQEKADLDLKATIKREREDAVKEYASQHNLPIVDTRSDVTHVMDFKDAPKTQHDRVAAALASFRSKQ